MAPKRGRDDEQSLERSTKIFSKHRSSLSKWKNFEEDLRDAAKRTLPTTDRRRYHRGLVIAVDFADTDINIKHDRDKFLTLMSGRFGFETEVFSIRAHTRRDYNQSWELRMHLSEAISKIAPTERGDSKGVLIVYFSGHSLRRSEDYYSPLILTGKVKTVGGKQFPVSTYVNWNSVIVPLSTLDVDDPVDTLCIFGCCSAALASIKGRIEGRIEVLAASSWESEAPADPTTYFTRRLCAAIQEMKQESFTAVQLIEKMAFGKTDDYAKDIARYSTAIPIYISADYPPRPSMLFHPINQLQPQVRINSHGNAKIKLRMTINDNTTIPSQHEWQKWIIRMPRGISKMRIAITKMRIEITNVEPVASTEVTVEVPLIMGWFLERNSCYKRASKVIKPALLPDGTTD